MTTIEKFNYWLELTKQELDCFVDVERVKLIMSAFINSNQLRYYELPEQKGIIAYVISDDFRGRDCVGEIFMYIKPEYRGDIRLFKKLINHLEEVAKENNCHSVKVASNIGYNDVSVLKVLERWGYRTDAVIKEIK